MGPLTTMKGALPPVLAVLPCSAYSGWHSHPGYLLSTVVSGQLVRYGTDCSSQTFGQSCNVLGSKSATPAFRPQSPGRRD